MDQPVTWGQIIILLKVILFLLGAGVLFYIILLLARLTQVMSNVHSIIKQNKPKINKSMEHLPDITKNVTRVSELLKDEMEVIHKVMDNVGKATDTAKDAVDTIKNDIIVKAKNILDIIEIIRKKFFNDKTKKKEIIYRYKYKDDNEGPEVTVREDVGEEAE